MACKIVLPFKNFNHLHGVNLSLQGTSVTAFQVQNKIKATIKKLDIWARRICKHTPNSLRRSNEPTCFAKKADWRASPRIEEPVAWLLSISRCAGNLDGKSFCTLVWGIRHKFRCLIDLSFGNALKLTFSQKCLIDLLSACDLFSFLDCSLCTWLSLPPDSNLALSSAPVLFSAGLDCSWHLNPALPVPYDWLLRWWSTHCQPLPGFGFLFLWVSRGLVTHYVHLCLFNTDS